MTWVGGAAGAALDPTLVGVDELAEDAGRVAVVVGDVAGQRAGDRRVGLGEHVVEADVVVPAGGAARRHPAHRDHGVAVVGERDPHRAAVEVGADPPLQALLGGGELRWWRGEAAALAQGLDQDGGPPAVSSEVTRLGAGSVRWAADRMGEGEVTAGTAGGTIRCASDASATSAADLTRSPLYKQMRNAQAMGWLRGRTRAFAGPGARGDFLDAAGSYLPRRRPRAPTHRREKCYQRGFERIKLSTSRGIGSDRKRCEIGCVAVSAGRSREGHSGCRETPRKAVAPGRGGMCAAPQGRSPPGPRAAGLLDGAAVTGRPKRKADGGEMKERGGAQPPRNVTHFLATGIAMAVP